MAYDDSDSDVEILEEKNVKGGEVGFKNLKTFNTKTQIESNTLDSNIELVHY